MLLTGSASGLAAAEQGQSVRVTGEVVALQCYPRLGEDGRGEAHASCARHCLAGGSDLGLLADETLYVVRGESSTLEQLRDFAADTVTVEGVVTERGEDVLLEVQSVDVP